MKGKRLKMILVILLICIVVAPLFNYMLTSNTRKVVKALKKHDVQELEMVLEKCIPADLDRDEGGIYETVFNIMEADMWHPLEYACANGTVEEMEMLINHGANVNIGGSYLLEIVLSDYNEPYEKAKLLIDNGIDVDKGREWLNYLYFERVLSYTSSPDERHSQLKTFKCIVEHSKKKYTIRGTIPISAQEEVAYVGFLEYAIEKGYLGAVKMLVEELDFDVNRPSKENGTPLALAKKLGEEEICNYLISKGAHE